MPLPRIILICGITLCYVTGDGMYRHDSGQQILLVKSMCGSDKTDMHRAAADVKAKQSQAEDPNI